MSMVQLNQECQSALIKKWQEFFQQHSWQELIQGHEPLPTANGLVYEFFVSDDVSCAILDMRELVFSDPHYHPAGNIEIYFVLQGVANVIIGGCEQVVRRGDTVVIPSLKAHFVIPDYEFVMAVVNTPPYSDDRYIRLYESNISVDFDYKQFARLSMQEAN